MQTDFSEDVRGVRVVRWNPERSPGTRVDNFGDLLGPLVVDHLTRGRSKAIGDRSLLSIGSILQFADEGDVVWGSGVNAKLRQRRLGAARALDVRAVRGPLTATMLEAEGSEVRRVFGDPGLLLPALFPDSRELVSPERRRHAAVFVPNVNDVGLDAAGLPTISPVGEPWAVIEQILSAGFVVGSSLHALITAEAYGVPARAVRSPNESIVKYVDYYEGTGRRGVRIADSVEEALHLGGVVPPEHDADSLLAAFPVDLWDRDRKAPSAPPPRPLDVIVRETVERAVGGDEGWPELARRIVVPVLRERGSVLLPDQMDDVMESARRLEESGMLEPLDERLGRTRLLADLRLGDAIRRGAVLDTRGSRAVMDSVRRAGSDGVLRLSGTLQLPDGRLRDHRILLELSTDELDDRVPVHTLELDEIDPTAGTVRWTAQLPVLDLREGASALVFTIEGPVAVQDDVVVRSAPPFSFHRWWHDEQPYRVDRTARGNVVIHRGTEQR